MTATYDAWGNAHFVVKTRKGRVADIIIGLPVFLEMAVPDVLEEVYRYAWTVDQYVA